MDEYKYLMDEAIKRVEVAENHLNFADKEFLDVAIFELSMAIKNLEVVVSQIKKVSEKYT